ncbi:MAG TPA: S24/S26 family peptidase [Candidatus Acidoferrales bacterium]
MNCRAAIELALATEVLRAFGELRFVAQGSSMLPSIFPGDTLLILRQPTASVRPGHVVLFSREGRFCAHRVVRAIEVDAQPFLITCGDALTQEDLPVPEHEFLGRVTAVLRFGKRIELEQTKSVPSFCLRWAVRRSNSVGTWLLRWHALRTRIARRFGAARSRLPKNLVECM